MYFKAGGLGGGKAGGGGGGGGGKEFGAGVVPSPLGGNVPISSEVKYDKRPKKDSVLNKHKKWLADLQKTKDRLEVEYTMEMRAKEEKKFQFQEHERRMREAAVTIIKDAKDGTETGMNAQAKEDGSIGAADSKSSQAKASSGAGAGAKASSSSRPVWAMSEEEAEAKMEQQMLAEEDDLLEFTKGLDFEKYIGDLEVQTMMDKLRKRIGDLEHEVALEEYRSSEGAERAQKREKLKSLGVSDATISAYEQSRNDPSIEAAKKLMEQEDAQGLQDIHSAKSVAMMLNAAKAKIEEISAGRAPQQGKDPVIINEPKIVVHDPEEGTRLNGKNEISNLPYMHRNPAV